jgi:hypothetical protein
MAEDDRQPVNEAGFEYALSDEEEDFLFDGHGDCDY